MNEVLDLQPGDRLLVSRTDRLGDLVLALPLVETLKARYPECRVDVMASLYASPILENNDRIDGIVRVQNDQLTASRHYRKELELKVVRADYRAVLVLYPERRISRLLYRAGIPIRIGTAGRFHSVFFTHRLIHSRKANRKHESEYNLDFLRYFREGPAVAQPIVYPTKKELNNAARILEDAGVKQPFVVLHPGSGGSAERWPMQNFVELSATLEKGGYRVVMTGSEAEGETVSRLADEAGISIAKITGMTDLRTLTAVLMLAELVVANSTGPLHLAAAAGTRVLGLYPGKQVMSPVRWGPVGYGHRVLQPQVDQCPCPDRQCRCMQTITVQAVAGAAEAVFKNAT
jgi:lipopolysaccharide heptosyltransferase II